MISSSSDLKTAQLAIDAEALAIAVEGMPLATLLDEVVAFLYSYMIMSTEQMDLLALWIAHTHSISAFEVTGYIFAKSGTKRSGKTRLLEIIRAFVSCPLKASNISIAALARSANTHTLLIDEVDTIFSKSGAKSEQQEGLRGILDDGYRSDGLYVRWNPNTNSLDKIPVFGAKAFGGIGSLPGTLEDRCFILHLERKKRSDRTVGHWRNAEGGKAAAPIRGGLQQWATTATEYLAAARPAEPEQLDDRAQEIWEPLFAVAQLAGDDWPERCWNAALAISSETIKEDDSLAVQLMADVRTCFAHYSYQDRLLSKQICEFLNGLDDAQWSGWNKPHGIQTRDLPRLLKPFRISSSQMRNGPVSGKGYYLSSFTEAWDRYLPSLVELNETPETVDIKPSWKAPETIAPDSANVSDSPQIETSYDISNVSARKPQREGEL